MTVEISDQEFVRFQRFIFEATGITLTLGKKALVAGRLATRLRECKMSSYAQYLKLLESGAAQAEVQRAVDLLTTNETYFFREVEHFAQLERLAQEASRRPTPFRVWSAASSSGEEAYSIAMVLAHRLPNTPWEVLGSDVSTRVLERARRGHYLVSRAEHIPAAYLKRYCLRGLGKHAGTLLITRELRSRVQFTVVNLNEPLPSKLGKFDVIFLRNVLIYFDVQTKREVVNRVAAQLKPHGHLLIGHCESLNGISNAVVAIAPAVYQLAARAGKAEPA